MTAGDRLLGAVAFDCRGHCSPGMRDIDNVHTAPDNDAFALELGEHDIGAFGIVFAERLRRFEDRHGAAEALRQFKTRRPGADDDEMLRPRCKIENAFAGQVGAPLEAGNCRQRRFRSGRYHEAAGTDLDIAGNDCVAVLELRLRVNDSNAEPGETFD